MEDINHSDSEVVEMDSRLKFKCRYCFRELSSRQNLREHLYIHTGEKPYVCNEAGCGQKFRQGSLLSIHRRIHLEVKKSKRSGFVSERRCVYPKLTSLLSMASVLLNENALDREGIQVEIGKEGFEFIKAYI